MSNPVHYAFLPYEGEEEWRGPGWYFWDETWANRVGPYETAHLADEAAKAYGEFLENGEP